MAAPTERSYLWTTGGAGDGASTYTRADWSTILNIVAGCNDGEGIGAGWLNRLDATAGTNKITVDTGVAIVDGKPYICSAGGDISIPSPTTYNRIDRIVLRCDWTAQTVRLTRIAGTESASPTAPAVTRTRGTTFDLYLYQVTVMPAGVVTISMDEREWARVETNQIADAAVTETKLGTGAVTATKLGTGAVTTAKIANDAVDDTKVGNRVAQFYRRQGGSSTNWSTAGTTTYTPGAVRVQVGVSQVTTDSFGYASVTFPVAFSDAPVVVASVVSQSPSTAHFTTARIDATASGFTILVKGHMTSSPYHADVTVTAVNVHWIAVGPE